MELWKQIHIERKVTIMFEHPKQLRRIYMVSSTTFGIASLVYGWMAPLGAVIGLAVKLTVDRRTENEEAFTKAVEATISKMKKTINSDSNKAILEELLAFEIEPDNLSDLIKKTEAYRTKYCTNANVTELVNIFDSFLRDEVSQSESLSHLFLLSQGLLTLDKLQMINDIICISDTKLNKIKDDIAEMRDGVSDVRSDVSDIKSSMEGFSTWAGNALRFIADGIVFVLLSMAVFLVLGIFLFSAYDRIHLIVVPICYGISYCLSHAIVAKDSKITGWILNRRKHAEYLRGKRKWLYCVYRKLVNPYHTFSILLSVSCFLIINLAIYQGDDYSLVTPIIGIILGNVFGMLLRNAPVFNPSTSESSELIT